MQPWEKKPKRLPKKEMTMIRRKHIGHYFQNRKNHRKKNVKIDEFELGDLEGEEETPTKWRDYDIRTLIAICGKMKEKIAQLIRKQNMK